MALETATKVSELNASNPVGATSPVSELDDHIRLIKTVLKAIGRQSDGEVTLETGTSATAVAGNLVICSNVAAVTLTLPASPTTGDCVSVLFTNGLSTNVINRNSQNIGGLAENMTVNTNTAGLILTLRYSGATQGWVLQ